MTFVARRRIATRAIVLDRSLESLPIFRLSDSAEDTAISFSPESGGRWRVLPSPGDRLPGTFDQDVYIELLHRYHEAGAPEEAAGRGGEAQRAGNPADHGRRARAGRIS